MAATNHHARGMRRPVRHLSEAKSRGARTRKITFAAERLVDSV